MNARHLITAILAAALGLALGLASGAFGEPSSSDRLEPDHEDMAAVLRRLDALEASLTRSAVRREPSASVAASLPAVAGPNAGPAATKVARVTAPEPVENADTGEAADAERERRAQIRSEVLDRLDDPNLGVDAKAALWRELVGSEGLEEIIAALRERAEQAPTDPDAAADLGNAYATAIRGGALAPDQRRAFTTGAMTAFDRALELDETHWEARFSQSMMQAFAPAALGLAPAARDNLQVLLEQQRARAPRPEDAHTYFFLANLRASTGDPDGAASLREEAARLFPRDRRFGGR